MDLIQPAEISGKIMTLLDQAKEKFIIVSPYNKVYNWTKLKVRLDKAVKRGVQIDWYIRKNVEGNREQILELGLKPIEVDNLHSKFYLNENGAVITSMNLHESSDIQSLDIGYYTEEEHQLEALNNYIHNYLISFGQSTQESLISPDIIKGKRVQKLQHRTSVENKTSSNNSLLSLMREEGEKIMNKTPESDDSAKDFTNLIVGFFKSQNSILEINTSNGTVGQKVIVNNYKRIEKIEFLPQNSQLKIKLRMDSELLKSHINKISKSIKKSHIEYNNSVIDIVIPYQIIDSEFPTEDKKGKSWSFNKNRRKDRYNKWGFTEFQRFEKQYLIPLSNTLTY